jgi:hypothetical protein
MKYTKKSALLIKSKQHKQKHIKQGCLINPSWIIRKSK